MGHPRRTDQNHHPHQLRGLTAARKRSLVFPSSSLRAISIGLLDQLKRAVTSGDAQDQILRADIQ
jgi:hypothetical protein